MKIVQRVQEIWSGHDIDGINPMTLNCDLEIESVKLCHRSCTPSH